VSWGRKGQTLKELFVALIERIVELTEHLVHEACNWLVVCVCVCVCIDSNDVQTQEYAHTHNTHTLANAKYIPELDDVCFY